MSLDDNCEAMQSSEKDECRRQCVVKKKEEKDEKKPFDKKAYRLKKYSKKYKLEQWEEQRKKVLLRNLQKELKNDEVTGTYKPKTFDEDVTDGQEVGRFVRHPDFLGKENVAAKKKPFLSAREKQEKIKQEKLEKQQQVQKAIEEKKQKLEAYRKKKQEKFKKLSRKTKKGQPVMTGRLELLLEKIQKNK
ncbi:hypothetical protein MSG28_013619 [Choristoneura fumiferana]|uniref:Uncharacterized protein n=1 Tax=Choristoneura fumiferana TaxID=7141 RepID=A0ACC0K8Q1_CHOFU|nr:hypothetical protein MSG28_013619 [Choristoneura fumiferana]